MSFSDRKILAEDVDEYLDLYYSKGNSVLDKNKATRCVLELCEEFNSWLRPSPRALASMSLKPALLANPTCAPLSS